MEVTLVEINVQPDKIADFLQVFHANHLGAVKEPGNLRFDVLQDSEMATRFFIYEAYVDEAAVLAHKKTPHYLACVAALEGIMSQGRKKTVFKGIYP
ncbi:(4S)-4-hydroxy-5-phosphonooxypentane-2,3-dione isomerase [Rahnella inusitata]|uniref:(4S)-4-hydroxy-5-phosphonooxypentane-2,3-dione isomerase n=1 Tax=Rahnella inusitata TaxID=58169 RepID=UPI0039AF34E4